MPGLPEKQAIEQMRQGWLGGGLTLLTMPLPPPCCQSLEIVRADQTKSVPTLLQLQQWATFLSQQCLPGSRRVAK